MKRYLCGIACLAFACVADAGTVRIAAGDAEVLVAPSASGATRFAAQEMTNFLSQVLGAPVPLVTAPSAGKAAIVVGTNGWSRAAGADPAALKLYQETMDTCVDSYRCLTEILEARHKAAFLAQGFDEKEAMKIAAKDRGVSKREIYEEIKK